MQWYRERGRSDVRFALEAWGERVLDGNAVSPGKAGALICEPLKAAFVDPSSQPVADIPHLFG